MTNLSLREKHKSRVGPVDYKRNYRAKRDGDRATWLIFISVAFILLKVIYFNFVTINVRDFLASFLVFKVINVRP